MHPHRGHGLTLGIVGEDGRVSTVVHNKTSALQQRGQQSGMSAQNQGSQYYAQGSVYNGGSGYGSRHYGSGVMPVTPGSNTRSPKAQNFFDAVVKTGGKSHYTYVDGHALLIPGSPSRAASNYLMNTPMGG